ncbi:MAG: hypothetical protein WAK93_19690 [Solirubrobacteraceae bacterium]
MTLRLSRLRDFFQIAELLERQGIELDELERARLTRFDPRSRVVICATALVAAHETVIGVGAIDIDGDRITEPTLVVVDEQMTDGLGELISNALVGRARTLAAARAA